MKIRFRVPILGCFINIEIQHSWYVEPDKKAVLQEINHYLIKNNYRDRRGKRFLAYGLTRTVKNEWEVLMRDILGCEPYNSLDAEFEKFLDQLSKKYRAKVVMYHLYKS